MKGLYKNLTKEKRVPGIIRGHYSNLSQVETEVVATMDTTFERYGRTWCVSVVSDTFIIGTDVDAKLDSNGEPCRERDIIRVAL